MYRYTHDGSRIELVHKTPVTDIPYTMAPFPLYGKVLIGIGNCVRIYDLGKKKLLKKCETKVRCVGVRPTYRERLAGDQVLLVLRCATGSAVVRAVHPSVG